MGEDRFQYGEYVERHHRRGFVMGNHAGDVLVCWNDNTQWIEREDPNELRHSGRIRLVTREERRPA